MSSIDNSIKFASINIALITISDSRKEDDDKSGNILNERITNLVFIRYGGIGSRENAEI